MPVVIKAENISKLYRLGVVGTGTLSQDLNRWWAKIRGKEDPTLKIGSENTLNKREGDYIWALRDMDFELQQGDVLGIIGKNGAGKSTLLKILSRVTAPTTGSVKINGRIASLLEVGTGFHPELTGRENIFLNGTILGMSKNEVRHRFDEIVDFAGVEKYIDTPVKRYSSGMYVRLGFAVAAHLDHEILIVDEVLAVGDAEFQKKAIGKMHDVSHGQGRTVLFVSHNIGSVRRLCDTGIILKNGHLLNRGGIEEIVDLYIRESVTLSPRQRLWDNEAQKPVCITGIRVNAANKRDDQVIDIGDVVKVILDYSVNEEISHSNISFSLYKDGIPLFRSWDTDSHPALFEKRIPGQYSAELILPDYLQAGTYSVDVGCGVPGRGAFDVKEEAIVFEIQNLATDGSMKSFSRGGMINANIAWNINVIH